MEFMELDDAQVAILLFSGYIGKTRMQQLENQVSLVFLGVFVWDFHMSWMRFGQF